MMKSRNVFRRLFQQPLHVITLLCLFAFQAGPANAQALRGMAEVLEAAVVVEGAIIGVASDGAIVRSLDQGASFAEIRGATPPDAVITLAASGRTVIAGGGSGLLLRAGDVVENPTVWEEVSSGEFLGDVRGLAHDGAGSWVAVGDGSFSAGVLLSADEGETWTAIANPPAAFLHAVQWNASASEWIAVGGDGFDGAIYRSADGRNWVESPLPFGTPSLLALAVDGAGQILAVGESGAMLLSTDDGGTFTSLGGSVSEDLNAVVPVGPGEWVIAGNDAVVLSVSGATADLIGAPDSTGPAIQSLLVMDGGVVVSGGEFVAPPVISPEAGQSAEAVSVELSAAPDAALYYTLDGSEPTMGANHYQGPFVVETTMTVKAVAVSGGIFSQIASAYFLIGDPEVAPLRLRIERLSGSENRLTLDSPRAGAPYQLETSVDLVSWFDLAAVQTGGDVPLIWDVESLGTTRFYRVVEVSPEVP